MVRIEMEGWLKKLSDKPVWTLITEIDADTEKEGQFLEKERREYFKAATQQPPTKAGGLRFQALKVPTHASTSRRVLLGWLHLEIIIRVRLKVMLQILLDHLLCHLPDLA